MFRIWRFARIAFWCILGWASMGAALRAEELRATDITNTVDKAMRFLKGREASGGLQYGDYVVFCGRSVERVLPQYKEIIDGYKKWIIDNDKFAPDYPYHSACHVMALDLAGKDKQAIDIFTKLKPAIFSADGKLNPFIYHYHLGWYLYGSVVAGDNERRDKILAFLSTAIENEPDKHHYFTAYCLLAVYERTKDEWYRNLFLSIVRTRKPYKEEYWTLAATDGHMGMALTVFCTAFSLTQDEAYRETAKRLAGVLVATQLQNGSWNDLTAYTIMPAEGLTAYLKVL